MSPDAPILKVEGLKKHFGGLKALDGVSFDIHAGEILGLAGPNGSGKTTTINAITGVFPIDGGEIHFGGNAIHRLPTFRRVRHGINRTFQVPRPFPALTVLENVMVAGTYRSERKSDPHRILEDLGLAEHADRPAKSLNSSQQKMLGLASALATSPQLLLVDEIGAGLNPEELSGMAARLRSYAAQGMAILVVEHLMDFLDRVTDRLIVMDAGNTLFTGKLQQATQDPRVIEAFLGG
ncbi:MAG: ABC transporter ATP-binding protein [Rhodanobacter sp.]|nr:MAG: ABC transporter ATP-binding protein [Rhodanobacter sp.]